MHKNTIFKYEIENRNKAPKYTKLIWPLSQEYKFKITQIFLYTF